VLSRSTIVHASRSIAAAAGSPGRRGDQQRDGAAGELGGRLAHRGQRGGSGRR
jgi:hypothetical protein